MPNWKDIMHEYITSDISLRALACEHNVSFNTLKDRAKREKWSEHRQDYMLKTAMMAVQNVSTPQKEHLPQKTPQTKIVVKEVEIPAPSNDVVRRTSKMFEVSEKLLRIAEDMMDTCRRPSDLKYISGALKDIKEVQMLKTALDDLEQQARIDKLRADAKQQDSEEERTVRVIIEGDEDE